MRTRKTFKKEITLKVIKKIAEFVSIGLGASFIFGFLIWNIYLYGFGFKEDNLMQTRFIYTGLSFVLITTPILYIFYLLFIFLIEQINKKFLKHIIMYVIFILSIIYIFFFTYFIFTRLPVGFGGGRPRSLSMLANIDELSYLSSFGINLAQGSKTQTINVCIAYDNNEQIIVLLNDRILQIKNDKINGLSNLPGISVGLSRNCSELARLWMKKTFIFEVITNKMIETQMKYEQEILQ